MSRIRQGKGIYVLPLVKKSAGDKEGNLFHLYNYKRREFLRAWFHAYKPDHTFDIELYKSEASKVINVVHGQTAAEISVELKRKNIFKQAAKDRKEQKKKETASTRPPPAGTSFVGCPSLTPLIVSNHF